MSANRIQGRLKYHFFMPMVREPDSLRGNLMEMLNLILDFVLVFLSVWMIITVRSSTLGGVIGNTMTFLTLGAVFLGIAHLAETVTFEVLEMDAVLVESLHRVIVLVGFGLMIVGFQGLSQVRIQPAN